MHGNVPFGQPGRVAASYAHKALDTANQVGTGMLVWIMQLVMQMLMEVLTRHHEKHRLKDYEAMMERLRYLEKWSHERFLELENDQGDTGQMVEFGQKLGDSLLDGMAPVPQPSPEKQREIALKLKEKHENKPENRKKWGGNNLEM